MRLFSGDLLFVGNFSVLKHSNSLMLSESFPLVALGVSLIGRLDRLGFVELD